jgi:hypothetical protein
VVPRASCTIAHRLQFLLHGKLAGIVCCLVLCDSKCSQPFASLAQSSATWHLSRPAARDRTSSRGHECISLCCGLVFLPPLSAPLSIASVVLWLSQIPYTVHFLIPLFVPRLYSQFLGLSAEWRNLQGLAVIDPSLLWTLIPSLLSGKYQIKCFITRNFNNQCTETYAKIQKSEIPTGPQGWQLAKQH